jgi:hypothetical protein
LISVNVARAVVLGPESKFLNRRAESRTAQALSQFGSGNKKFSQILQASAAQANFPNACPRYVDK